MSGSTFSGFNKITVDDRNKINAIVDGLKSDHPIHGFQKFESLLGEVEPRIRPQLLYELLRDEQERLAPFGATLSGTALADHFPDFEDAIKAAINDYRSEALNLDIDSLLERPEQIKGKRFGKFELVSLLGSGEFGAVFEARDCDLNRVVALKLPRQNAHEHSESMSLLLEEAKNAASVSHQNIVPVYEAGFGGSFYVASELVRGSTLRKLMKDGDVNERRKLEIVRDLAAGVAYAHERGIVHNDIKPENVMVDEFGVPKLTDFGLARTSATYFEPKNGGSLAYASPERINNPTGKHDARSDIWSLGILLFELVQGVRPFTGSEDEVCRSILNASAQQFDKDFNWRDKDIRSIVLKSLRLDPEDRYQSAGELESDLRRYLSGEPIIARPVSSVERIVKWFRRNKVVSALLAVVSFLLIVFAISMTLAFLNQRHLNNELETSNNQLLDSIEKENQATETAKAAVVKGTETVTEFLLSASESKELMGKAPGLQRLRKELLEKARTFFDDFAELATDDVSIQLEIVRSRLASAKLSRQLLELEKAQSEFSDIRLRAEKEIQQNIDEKTNRFWQFVAADATSELGLIKFMQRENDEAIELSQKAWEQAKQLVANPDSELDVRFLQMTVGNGNRLGLALMRKGERERAIEVFSEAIEIGKELQKRSLRITRNHIIAANCSIASVYNTLGVLHAQGKEFDKTREYWNLAFEALAEFEVSELAPHAQNLRLGVSRNLADMLAGGQPKKARKVRENVVRDYKELVTQNPQIPKFRFQFIHSCDKLLGSYIELNELEQATALLDESKRSGRLLINEFPENVDYLFSFLAVLDSGIELTKLLGQNEVAFETEKTKIERLLIYIEKSPDNERLSDELVQTFNSFAKDSTSLGLDDEAFKIAGELEDRLDKIGAEHATEPRLRQILDELKSNLNR